MNPTLEWGIMGIVRSPRFLQLKEENRNFPDVFQVTTSNIIVLFQMHGCRHTPADSSSKKYSTRHATVDTLPDTRQQKYVRNDQGIGYMLGMFQTL